MAGLNLNDFHHQWLAGYIEALFDQTDSGRVACTVADHKPVEAESQRIAVECPQLGIAGFAVETACMGVESG